MSHIETGNTKLSLAVLVDLANALGVSTDALLFGSEKVNKEAISGEISLLLEDCTLQESMFIKDLITDIKISLRKSGLTAEKIHIN